MIVGALIKQKRLERRMSQQPLAKRLGVPGAMVANWEHGYCLPEFSICCALAEIFSCSADELYKCF